MVMNETIDEFGFEFAHIGINCADEADAEAAARFFCTLFGFEYLPTPNSIFSGNGIEAMKSPYYGKYGHIAIRCNQIERAVDYLKSRGIAMHDSSAKSDEKGLIAVYFEQEVAGFAIHLLRSAALDDTVQA